MGKEQRALTPNVNRRSENRPLSKPNLVHMPLASATITALTGCGLVGVASGFSAQKAAIGYWSCEPVGKNNGHDNEVVIVDVRKNHTFTLTTTDSDDAHGTWRVFDGDLALVLKFRDGRDTLNLRVPSFSKLGIGSTKISFSINGRDSPASPRIKVIGASRFEITQGDAKGPKFVCRQRPTKRSSDAD